MWHRAGAPNFKNLAEIPSGPAALFGEKLLIILATSAGHVGARKNEF